MTAVQRSHPAAARRPRPIEAPRSPPDPPPAPASDAADVRLNVEGTEPRGGPETTPTALRAQCPETPARGRPRETCEHPGRDAIRRGPTRPCRQGLRAAHAFIAVIDLMGHGFVWTCALTRRRDSLLRFSAAALVVAGAGLVIGRGDCPLGPLQRRLGDPVPLFRARSPTTRGTSCRPDSRRDLCCRARPARSSAPTRSRHVITWLASWMAGDGHVPTRTVRGRVPNDALVLSRGGRGCGQDRDRPLVVEGRLLVGHGPREGVWGGGRQVVR